jgi:hypothetical protein
MGISRWLLNDWFTAHELDVMDARHERDLSRHALGEQKQDRELAALRADLGKLAVLTKALATLCIEKNVLTAAELKAKVFEVDRSDGLVDGALDLRKAGLDT